MGSGSGICDSIGVEPCDSTRLVWKKSFETVETLTRARDTALAGRAMRGEQTARRKCINLLVQPVARGSVQFVTWLAISAEKPARSALSVLRSRPVDLLVQEMKEHTLRFAAVTTSIPPVDCQHEEVYISVGNQQEVSQWATPGMRSCPAR